MRFLLVGVALMAFGGCAAESTTTTAVTEEPHEPSEAKSYTLRVEGSVGSRTIRTVVLDGCEYLVCEVHTGWVLSHKGNCHNHGR